MADEEPRRKSIILRPTWMHKERPKQYVQRSNRPRWVLHMQAVFWRTLMQLGMFFHRLAPPQPPKPNFHRSVTTTISSRPGHITLFFYTPPDYETQKRLWMSKRHDIDDEAVDDSRDRSRMRMSIGSLGDGLRRRKSIKKWGGYPVVINFHGGGFTLGSPHDDGRWCSTVVQECNAVVVTVDYRLAPENPFPTAIEDGADAVLWVHKHAEELGIDVEKICISGFSSGGNMAFSVPLRLYDEQSGFARNESIVDGLQSGDAAAKDSAGQVDYLPPGTSDSTESNYVAAGASTTRLIDQSDGTPTDKIGPRKTDTSFAERPVHIPDIKIKCIVPWYPSLDYTRTREERRGTCKRADQELPAFFTDLFDDSYLHPPKDVALDSPYLSPGVAPTALLRNALPEEIILHTCEWDMLLEEGEEFHQRLISPEVGKTVHYTMVPGVPHGWDKAPNPWKPTPGVREHYLNACKEMRRILGQTSEDIQRRRSVVR